MPTQVLESPLGQFSGSESQSVANFHPTFWGDQFMTYTPEDEVSRTCKEKQLEDQKEEIRKKLMNAASNTIQQLKFIDAAPRLGVAYHFEREIEEALQHIHDTYPHGDDIEGDIYDVALQFRLLSQAGHNSSCGNIPEELSYTLIKKCIILIIPILCLNYDNYIDIFNKFKNEKGKFKKDLISDVLGMLGLYEAAHHRVHGEDIMDEALAFTTTHLTSMVKHLEYPLVDQVAHALKQPLRKGLERLEPRWYISIYQDETWHDTTLLKLAKLDFKVAHALKQPLRKGLEQLEPRWYISMYQDETWHDTTLLKLAKLDFSLVRSLHKE